MAATVEVDSDFPVAKKLRRAECALMMVLDDKEMLESFSQPDSQTEVLCLSQTVRTVGDIEGGERVAVVVPSDVRPIPWHKCLLENRYANLVTRSVLVGEALKTLEADFTEILHSYLGMRMYEQTLCTLTKAIQYAAKSLKQHYDSPLVATFGVFSTALVHLLDAEPSSDVEKEELSKRCVLGKALFLEVIQEGVTSLREKCETEMTGTDGQFQEVFDFMCRDASYDSIVREWATVARTRLNRNAASHPFSGLTSHAERQTAIDYFGSLVNGEYCEKFRNVALLSKLHLQLADIKESSSFKVKKVVVDELL